MFLLFKKYFTYKICTFKYKDAVNMKDKRKIK